MSEYNTHTRAHTAHALMNKPGDKQISRAVRVAVNQIHCSIMLCASSDQTEIDDVEMYISRSAQ